MTYYAPQDLADFRSQDVLSCRYVDDRIDELAASRYEWVEEQLKARGLDGEDTTYWDSVAGEWAESGPEGFKEEAEDLRILEEFRDDVDGYSGDRFRDTDAINDTYFEDYARQLAEDIGAIDPKADWPLTYIDWKAAAAALRQDYAEVDLDGTTFWVRM